MTLATTPIDPNTQDGAGQGEKPPGKKADDMEGDGQERFQLERIPGGWKPLEIETIFGYRALFADAFNRLLSRNRRDKSSFDACFRPLLLVIRGFCKAEAEAQLGIADVPNMETDKFISDYVGGMEKRGAAWKAESADDIVTEELGRALRAIRVAVYRECATAKAKGDPE